MAASAIINNKFLHYQTLNGFNTDLEAGYVRPGSIAFIDGNSSIWSHGKFYYCAPEDFATIQKAITDRLDKIEGTAETEGSIAYAVTNLQTEINNKLGELEKGKTVAEMIAEIKAEFEANVMEKGYTTEVTIGGLNKGTNVGEKSAVEVLNLILKPEYAPVFTDATCTISGPAASGTIYEVGTTTPAASAYTSSGNTAKTKSGSFEAFGGAVTETFTITGKSAGATDYETVTTTSGVFTVKVTRAYAAGTDVVKSNKGNATNKTGNGTTLLENASANNNIDSTSHTIKAITKEASHTLNYAYKVYASTVTAGTLTAMNLDTKTSNREAILKGGAAGQKFAVPATYTGIKIEEYNDTLKSWTDTTSNWTTSTQKMTLADGTEKAYTVYNRANVSGENMKARISATQGA